MSNKSGTPMMFPPFLSIDLTSLVPTRSVTAKYHVLKKLMFEQMVLLCQPQHQGFPLQTLHDLS
jgi:hypothetical protein